MNTMQANVPIGFEAAAQYLQSYSGDFVFLKKLRQYYNRFNILSDRQWQAVVKCMQNETKKSNVAQRAPLVDSCDVNIVLTRFLAQRIANEQKIAFTPFTYKVTSILWETNKAYGVRMKPNYSNVSVCMCCGKALTDWRSQATGMGLVCATNLNIPYVRDKNDIQRFKQAIQIKFDAIGEFTATLPKSQIKEGLKLLTGLYASGIISNVKQPTISNSIPAVTANSSPNLLGVKKPIISLLSLNELSYNEQTQTLSAEISDLGTKYNYNSETVVVTNPDTGNTVSFRIHHTDTDGEGHIYGWAYLGVYNNFHIKLLLIND